MATVYRNTASLPHYSSSCLCHVHLSYLIPLPIFLLLSLFPPKHVQIIFSHLHSSETISTLVGKM